MLMKASLSFATFIIQNLFTTLLNTFAKILQLIKTKSLQYGMPRKLVLSWYLISGGRSFVKQLEM